MNLGNLQYRRLRSDKRLAAIERNIHLRDMRILDVGCNRGFFTIQLAEKACEVIGMDRDSSCIAEAAEMADRLDIQNVDFVEADLTPQGLAHVHSMYPVPEPFDAILCLSVLHHVICDTPDYGKQLCTGLQGAWDILRCFYKMSPLLVLEIGDRHEHRPWASKMPALDVPQMLHGVGYKHVSVVPPPGFEGPDGKLQKLLHATLYEFLSTHARCRRAVGFDNRDGRPLYIARR